MKYILKNIPNILTLIRIILTPFIIYLSVINNFKLCIVLIVISSLTDLFDGMIARKFNLVSSIGAKLDAIADKLFGGCLIITLLIKNNLFILCLIGEIIIVIINLIAYFKKRFDGTIFIGKVKTTILFITICLGFLSLKFTNLTFILNMCILMSFIFQILCIICYINCFINYKLERRN